MGTKVKFYSQNLINADTTYSLTTANTSLADNLYDNDNNTVLSSIASSDSVSEIWTFTFSGSQGLDRIFIANHNIGSGKLEYDSAGSWADFSTPITWTTTSATDTNYYEVNSITTTKLRLTMDTTQSADEQKQVGEFRAFSELGEVAYNPQKGDPRFDEASRNFTTDDNSSVYVYFGDKFRTKLQFDNAEQADLELFRSLKDRRTPFYVYLNGGDTTSSIYEEGWRFQDMYLVNYVNNYEYKLQTGALGERGAKISLDLRGAY